MNKSFQCFACGKIDNNGWYYNKFNPKRYNTEQMIMKQYQLANLTEYFYRKGYKCQKIDENLNTIDYCDNCKEKIHKHIHTPIEELNTPLSLILKLSAKKEEKQDEIKRQKELKEEMRKKYYEYKKLKNDK